MVHSVATKGFLHPTATTSMCFHPCLNKSAHLSFLLAQNLSPKHIMPSDILDLKI